MPETTTEVRADIEQTRARMSSAIAELEGKLDIAQKVREHPWTAVGLAFGAGIALSASGTDLKAAQATSHATRETSSRLGVALDGVVAALVTGVSEAIHARIDGAVREVVTSIRGDSSTRPLVGFERQPEPTSRAD